MLMPKSILKYLRFAEKYIKIFTFLNKEEVDALVTEHNKAPHLRLLQKRLAEEITTMVHSEADLANAIKASNILFGKSTSDDLKQLDEQTFLDVFDGVPQAEILLSDIENGLDIISALAEKSGFLKSNGEARRALKENSISVNKEKVGDSYVISSQNLINNKFILLQRGKKNYFVLSVK
jgi:tyrosyl-tRNA synthetase